MQFVQEYITLFWILPALVFIIFPLLLGLAFLCYRLTRSLFSFGTERNWSWVHKPIKTIG